MKISIKPSLIFLLRNWKSGELKLMSFAIFISVLCITSIVFLTESLHVALEDKSGVLLGSDKVITSPIALNPEWEKKAQALHIKTTTTLNFLSMLVHNNELSLAEVKAIGSGYPLRGALRTAFNLFDPDREEGMIPEHGTVWLESRLFPLLNVKMHDEVMIGAAHFKITRVLTAEPDRTLEGINLAPRALINEGDVPATQIIQPGSRVTYKLLLAGEASALSEFESWVTPQLTPSQSFIDSHHSRPIVNTALERVNEYLGLAFMINVSLAGIAIAMVTRRFCQRQYDTVAILRCFGASSGWILRRYLFSLTMLGLSAGSLGICCGYAVKQFITLMYFKEMLPSSIKTVLGFPAVIGLLTIFALLFGFAFPPLLDLSKITPLRILRRDLPLPKLSSSLVMIFAFSAVALLIMLQTRDVKLTGTMILMTLSVSLIILVFIDGLLNGISKATHFLSIASQLNFRNVARRASENALQVLAFSLVLCLVGTLYLVRSDLLNTWQNQIPPRAPNYFALNIPPSGLSLFQTFMHKTNIKTSALYPMIVGRLMAINQEVVEMSASNHSKNRVFSRLLNFTWASTLQKDNRIVEGEWFEEKDTGQLVVSVEQGFAERLGIKIGDTIKLQIGEKIIAPLVKSIRTVEWDSFQPNFYVVFPPRVLDSLPITYMTSFYLPSAEIGFLKTLLQHFPMINVIDTQMVMSQLKSFINVIAGSIQYLWGFTLVSSFILLFAAITSTLDERKEEATLLRILGVSDKQLLWILLSEFILLGTLAGIVGAISASFITYWLAHHIFELTYHINTLVLFMLPLIGMLLVGLGGWLGTRRVFLAPPLRLT